MNTAQITANVFAFEQTQQSLRSAEKFGRLQYIFDKSQHEQRASVWECEALADDIIASLKLKGFNPNRDYIIATGNILHVVQLTAAVTAEYGQVNFLLYDAMHRAYVDRKLGIPYDD